MTFISQFFVMAMVAVTLENAVFTRALGTSGLLSLNKPRGILIYGAVLTFVTTLSNALTWAVQRYWLSEYEITGSYRSFIFLVCIAMVYLATYYGLKAFWKSCFVEVEKLLPSASFSCSVLASVLLAVQKPLTFASSVGYGFGMGVGFILAMLIVCEGRKRLEICSVPRAFAGMPVLLLYIGLLSLAIYGLTGHQLPS